jgi:protein-S-isoprenylcysteine O-methyltransferase Ste14
MKTDYVNTRFRPDHADPAYRAMVAFGLWLRAGSVGLAGAAIGLIMLVTGETAAWIGIATAVAGAAVATVSWRKALAIVAADDATPSAKPLAGTVTRADSEFGPHPRSAVSR